MRAVLDTSVLIGADAPGDVEAAISVVSITELHFGVLVAEDDDERARRTDRLAAIEAAFDPLPISVEVARAWGRLAAAVTLRGGNPRRRQIDLVRVLRGLLRRRQIEVTECERRGRARHRQLAGHLLHRR